MRVNITLACTECGDRNYISKKNKRNNPERIELKKYCPRLKRVTLLRLSRYLPGSKAFISKFSESKEGRWGSYCP